MAESAIRRPAGPTVLGRSAGEPVASLAITAVRLSTAVTLPRPAVTAAFRLFGAQSSAAQLGLLWRTVGSPSPGLGRLRRRAVRALQDYRAILQRAPRLRGLMKLDFTILLGLYTEAMGISRDQAVDAGLVESYCHLSALVDAYDDLLDTPEARTHPLAPADFLQGHTGRLRDRLTGHLMAMSDTLPGAAGLEADLAAFERQALIAHRSLDLATGLDAPLEAVVRARAATSGLLLRFAAHTWSVLLDLPPNMAAASEDAAATFGLVAQFADDVIDWSTDDGTAQNLLGAALREHATELLRARAAARRRPGWSLPFRTLRRVAPASLNRLAAVRRQASCYPPAARFAGLRQFGDDVYGSLLPALPAINFGAFDDIRLQVQAALAGIDRSLTGH